MFGADRTCPGAGGTSPRDRRRRVAAVLGRHAARSAGGVRRCHAERGGHVAGHRDRVRSGVRAEGDLDFRGTLGVDRGAPVGSRRSAWPSTSRPMPTPSSSKPYAGSPSAAASSIRRSTARRSYGARSRWRRPLPHGDVFGALRGERLAPASCSSVRAGASGQPGGHSRQSHTGLRSRRRIRRPVDRDHGNRLGQSLEREVFFVLDADSPAGGDERLAAGDNLAGPGSARDARRMCTPRPV